MERGKIIELAREVGVGEPESLYGRTDYVVMTVGDLERFANLIEREVRGDAEPVAWRMYPFDYGIGMGQYYALTNLPEQVCAWQNKGWKVEPLYTHPTYSVNMETFENEVQLGVIRHWPNGFADRLEYVWKDLIGFTPDFKLYDLKRVLAEFGFTMQIYEGDSAKEAGL